MEQDPEIKGTGNSYTTEFRQYDPRIGRWLSLDPHRSAYPSMSPYIAFNNNPIFYVDPYGLDGEPLTETSYGTEVGITTQDNVSYDNGNTLPTVAEEKYYRVVNLPTLNSCNVDQWSVGRKTTATNLWINIRHFEAGGYDYNDWRKEPYEDGDYLVVFAESLAEGSQESQSYFGDRRPENTVVNAHGVTEMAPNEFGENVATGERVINNREGYEISRYDIDDYLSNSRRLSDVERGEIQGLVDLINFTNGNFVLLSCQIGKSKQLVSSLEDLHRAKVTSAAKVYINGDLTTISRVNGQVNISSKPLTQKVKSGWILITSEGRLDLLKSEGNTGNLIVSPNKPYVQEEKKKSD